MATKKPAGLGRGLEVLLGPKVAGPLFQSDLAMQAPGTLALSALVPGAYQPRTRMDEGALYELAESIKAQGVMQPILVRPLRDGAQAGKYEIIAGERRFRACKLAGLSQVPVLVREVTNEAAAVMALIENIQREDLNPLEEAQGFKTPGGRIWFDARSSGAGGGPFTQRCQQPVALAQPGRTGATTAVGGRHRYGPCTRAADTRPSATNHGGKPNRDRPIVGARGRTVGQKNGKPRTLKPGPTQKRKNKRPASRRGRTL